MVQTSRKAAGTFRITPADAESLLNGTHLGAELLHQERHLLEAYSNPKERGKRAPRRGAGSGIVPVIPSGARYVSHNAVPGSLA